MKNTLLNTLANKGVLAYSILFLILVSLHPAKAQSARAFTFCNETSDTIQMPDLAKCIELKAADSKLTIKGFTMSVKYGEHFVDYDPIDGNMIPPDNLDEIIKHKYTMNYIDIKEIVVQEGKSKKKVKGYRIFVKKPSK